MVHRIVLALWFRCWRLSVLGLGVLWALPPVTAYADGIVSEVSVGVLDHDVRALGGKEHGIDMNGESNSSRRSACRWWQVCRSGCVGCSGRIRRSDSILIPAVIRISIMPEAHGRRNFLRMSCSPMMVFLSALVVAVPSITDMLAQPRRSIARNSAPTCCFISQGNSAIVFPGAAVWRFSMSIVRMRGLRTITRV
jgi:hypothetical protein